MASALIFATSAANLPTLLNGYAVRPAWAVAGVDYYVGLPSNTVLKDPESIVISGVSVNTSLRRVRIDSPNITLDGYDFSLHSGYWVYITAANAVIKNCNFALGTNGTFFLIQADDTSSNLTVQNCTMDAITLGVGPALIGFYGSGSVTLLNNYFKNFPQHVLECVQNAGVNFSVVFKYNLINQGAIEEGAHLNYLQFNSGTIASVDVQYNTSYQNTVGTLAAGEGYQFYFNSAGGVMSGILLAFNTLIAKGGAPGTAMSYMIDGAGASNSGTIHDNYFDRTAALGAFYPSSLGGITDSNNINMVTNKQIHLDNTET